MVNHHKPIEESGGRRIPTTVSANQPARRGIDGRLPAAVSPERQAGPLTTGFGGGCPLMQRSSPIEALLAMFMRVVSHQGTLHS